MLYQFYKSLYVVLLCTLSIDAHAMKRAHDADEVINIDMEVPDELIVEIMKQLSLTDISVGFVNKRWSYLCTKAFPDFFELQNSYHECKAAWKNQSLCHHNVHKQLQKLRSAIAKIDANPTESTCLMTAFLHKNSTSLDEIKTTPDYLLQAGFKKYPERLTQIMFMRIGEANLPPEYDWMIKLNPKAPPLKVLASSDNLIVSFTNERDWPVKLDFAMELCRRNKALEVINCGQKLWLTSRAQAIALYEVAFNYGRNIPAGALFEAGTHYYNNKDYPQAATYFERTIAAEGEHATCRSFVWAAHAHFGLKDWERAAKHYQNALLKNPSDSKAAKIYLNLALTFSINNNRQQALKYVNEAYLRDINNTFTPGNYAILAHICFENKDYKQTAQFFSLAFRKDEKNELKAHDYAKAAITHVELKEFSTASELFKSAFDKDSKCELPASVYARAAVHFYDA